MKGVSKITIIRSKDSRDNGGRLNNNNNKKVNDQAFKCDIIK